MYVKDHRNLIWKTNFKNIDSGYPRKIYLDKGNSTLLHKPSHFTEGSPSFKCAETNELIFVKHYIIFYKDGKSSGVKIIGVIVDVDKVLINPPKTLFQKWLIKQLKLIKISVAESDSVSSFINRVEVEFPKNDSSLKNLKIILQTLCQL